jgi:hypothetical protein
MMRLIVVLAVIVWLYLPVGFGIILLCQVVAKKLQKSEYYWFLAYEIRLMFWPIILIVCILMVLEVALRKLLQKLWDGEDK